MQWRLLFVLPMRPGKTEHRFRHFQHYFRFYNEHRSEIEAHKKAQEVYSLHDGKLPTLKELSEEYEKLKAQKEADTADLAALKSKATRFLYTAVMKL